MKKNIQINIGGSVFSIDEDAYQKLAKYLETIKVYLGPNEERDEIMQDIEMRIAELLLEKQTSFAAAITIQHVEEVIQTMGRPEDYRLEEEEVHADFTYKPTKKLFRDKEDRFIAGVASGLSYYLGIDTVWMRLLWVLIVLAGFGSPILIYILLWILVPEARTTSEKLQMKGKPVNLSNIEKSLKKEYANVAEKVKNADLKGKASSFKNKSANFFDGLLKVGKVLMRFLLILIGISLLILSILVITIFLVQLVTPGYEFFHSNISFYEEESLSLYQYWIGRVAMYLSLIIPFIFLLILSLFVINPKINFAGIRTKTSLLSVWIIAIVTTSYIYFTAKMATKYTGSTLQHIELPVLEKDTLIIKTKQHPTLSHLKSRDKHIVQKDSLGEHYIYGTDFHITIKPTDEPQPSMVIEKSTKANTVDRATDLTHEISYTYDLEENTLVLDDHYFLLNTKQSHHAKINIFLNLPSEMVFSIDENLATKNYKNNRRDQVVAKEYLQIKQGIIHCTSCLEEKPKENKPTTDWEKRVEKAFD